VWLASFLLASSWVGLDPRPLEGVRIRSSPPPDPSNPIYLEQISCDVENCTTIPVEGEEENQAAESEVLRLLRKEAAKVVVDFRGERFRIEEERNQRWKEYLREISKRDGLVVFEPYYMGARGIQLSDIPVFGDYIRVGWTIYSRLRSFFLYRAMKRYNAKVLYHPQSLEVMMIYFVHKDFGGICETVFSRCNVIEYLDDEIFDGQLALALDRYPPEEILIRFNQTEAVLPRASIELEALTGMSRSARIYKWLIAAKTVETKSEVRGRFLSPQTVLTILDYSIQAYDFVRSIQMYAKAREWKATIFYKTDESGNQFRSVEFSKMWD